MGHQHVIWPRGTKYILDVEVMVLNAIFNNISVLSWPTVLLVQETRVHFFLYPEKTSCNNVAPVTNLCLGRATTQSHSPQWSKKKVAVET
jgi:hypothetical protein